MAGKVVAIKVESVTPEGVDVQLEILEELTRAK